MVDDIDCWLYMFYIYTLVTITNTTNTITNIITTIVTTTITLTCVSDMDCW